jgi:arsenate reductase-like glutaredoxin family protein
MDFKERIEKIMSETEERMHKFIEELRSESKNFSAKNNELTGREAYEKLRDFYFILIRFKIKYIEIEYDFHSQLDKLKTSIEHSNLNSDDKRKLYDVIDDLSAKFSESRNSIKDLDNLINELKPKIQSKEVDVKSLHIEETINNIAENTMKTLTIFKNSTV